MDLLPIRELLRSRVSPGGTHWGECWRTHVDCAAWNLLDEVERLRGVVEGLERSWDSLADEMTKVEAERDRLLLDGSEGGEDGQ